MPGRATIKLSILTAVAGLVMAAGPARALADAPPGEGDMYQPWVPGEPKPTPKPGRGNPAGDPGQTGPSPGDTVVVVGPAIGAASKSGTARAVRAGSRQVIAALPGPDRSLGGGPNPDQGPSQLPVAAAVALACLGCAWLLRPRRD